MLAGRATVAVGVSGAARASRAGVDTTVPAVVTAITPAAEERTRPVFAAGRFVSERELRDSARVAVVSHGLARTLTGGGAATSILGTDILLEGIGSAW